MIQIAILILLTAVASEQTDTPTVAEVDYHRKTGNYEKAIHMYESILDGGSADAVEARIGLVKCFLDLGRYDDAIATTESPETMAEHLVRSEALMAVGRYREALVAAKTAILPDNLDPRDLPVHLRAFVQTGKLSELLGRQDEAIVYYERVVRAATPKLHDTISDSAAFTAIGTGLLRHSVLTKDPQLTERIQFVLQDFYQTAYENLDRHYWPARIAAADLLRSRHHHEQSIEDYEAALKINPDLAVAHVGLGWIALDTWNFELCEQKIESALDINPNAVDAHVLKSALRLTERKYEDALAAAESALAINPHSVQAMGHAAAANHALNRFDAVDTLRRRAKRVSPIPADFHRPLADSLAARRQYAASETEYNLAIEYDPTDPHPRTELGLMYMQWGREEQARTALTAAWKLDPFDARTLNVLNLLNDIADFETLETENFVIAYSHPQDALLAPYLADYLEEIHEELVLDFNADITEKTLIELFGSHRAFGVRITGKPWIHTVGACTGRVIAIESPRTDPDLQGPFHIARVLRHEYTHTVTLAATGNRIPHWFTEGLAVMQEDAPPPFAWRQQMADALRRDQLFTLESIDWGFMRPRRPGDRQLAYSQSEWMCQFIVDRFGYAAIEDLISAFRDRKSQPDAMAGALKISPTEFDTRFRIWARQQVSEWGFPTDPPEDIEQIGHALADAKEDGEVLALKCRLARAHLDAGDVQSAMFRAMDVLQNEDDATTCLTVLGEAALTMHDQNPTTPILDDPEFASAMQRLIKLDPDGWVAPKCLATIALDNEHFDDAIDHFEQLARVRPIDPAAARGLAAAYLAKDDTESAIPHLTRLTFEEQDDAEIPAFIARFHADAGRLHDARHWYLQSIYINAFNPGTHVALLNVCEQLGDKKCIAREHASLCLLKDDFSDWQKHCDSVSEVE